MIESRHDLGRRVYAALAAGVLATLPTAAQAQATLQTASAPAPDPARVALARKLMDQIMPPATRNQMMQSIMASMSQNMVGTLLKNPQISAEIERTPGARDVFDRFLQRQIDSSTQDLIANLPAMLDAMANAYARKFTLPQLTDMQAFFATPTGQVYIAESPKMMTDPDVQGWMSGLMTRSMQRTPQQVAELKKELDALPKSNSNQAPGK